MNRFKFCKLCCFLAVIIIGAAIPLAKVIEFEFPSTEPLELKFKAAGFDPRDPFRGRYLALMIEDSLPVKESPAGAESLFITFTVDDAGFARPLAYHTRRPETPCALRVHNYYQLDGNVGFIYPFDRFYVNEDDAERAERLFLETPADDRVLVVKLHANGTYQVTDLLLGGISIQDKLDETTAADN